MFFSRQQRNETPDLLTPYTALQTNLKGTYYAFFSADICIWGLQELTCFHFPKNYYLSHTVNLLSPSV